jgi:hypothetical protein
MKKTNSWLSFALLAALVGGGSVAVGQRLASGQDKPAQPKPADGPKPAGKDEGKKPEGDREQSGAENTATTRFIESFTVGDWEKAEKYYDELVQNWPLYAKDPVYAYKYAYTLYNLRSGPKKEKAKHQLQGLLEQDADHILALFLLSQIEAEQFKADKPQPLEDAKEHLLQAAKNGFYTLREVRASKAAEFKQLQEDPKFILRAMRASQEFPAVNIKNARNPFQQPRVNQSGKLEQGGPAMTAREIATLEAKIDALFVEIEKLIRDKEIDKLAPLFQDLNNIMTEYRKIGVEKVAANLKKWEKKLDEWKEVRLAIQLQIYINRGNECLRTMLKAKQNEKFDEVFEQFNEVKSIVEQMRHEEREEFHRNADALLVRAKGLNDEALKLKKIKEFNLIVTGIVVDPRPESKNRAIIVFDDPSSGEQRRGRIYEEKENIRDKEDRKVPGLTVEKISEGAIEFRYEDTKFVRQLKAPE